MRNQCHRIALTLLLLAFLGLLASCQSQDANPATALIPTQTPSNTPAPTATLSLPEIPTLAPTPDEKENRNAVVNALLALYLTPNRMNVATVLSDNQTQNTLIEFIPPDRKHILDVAGELEYIVTGVKVYVKTSGAWEETNLPASTFLGEGEITAQTISATLSDVQWVRQDTLDGKAVIVYRYNSTSQSGDTELHNQTELWIGEQDGLPYKMIVNGEVLSASTDPNTGEKKLQTVNMLTTTLVDFEATIQIDAPIPSSTPSPTCSPSPAPSLTPTLEAVEYLSITYRGSELIVQPFARISFQVHPLLAEEVAAHAEYTYGKEVGYTRFSFAPDGECWEVGCLMVYPVEPFLAAYNRFLFLPAGYAGGAAILLESRGETLAFQSGSGARTLEMHGQMDYFANNGSLMYVFRGYTEDQTYAIYLQYPLQAPILFSPEAAFNPTANTNPQALPAPTASPNDPPGSTIAGYNVLAYNQLISQQLNDLAPQDFTPSLELLDALVASLRIEE